MNGIIIVNKEKDCTSRDVVNVISKHLKTKKVGHTGTLDPMAKGVLVICIGTATKLVDLITSYDKEYVAEVTLGVTTDTLDSTGLILEEKKALITEEEINKVLNNMVGTYMQEAPIYSAIKIDGKKLYEYARANVDVVLPKRQVTVNSLELVSDIKYVDNKTIFTIKTNVSKGTYIRSLIRDIATMLNTIGLMSDLIRTRQGEYKIEDAYLIEDIKNNNFKIMPIKDVLKDIKNVVITDDIKLKIANGNEIPDIYNEDILFVDDSFKEVALYHSDNGKFRPYKMFKE